VKDRVERMSRHFFQRLFDFFPISHIAPNQFDSEFPCGFHVSLFYYRNRSSLQLAPYSRTQTSGLIPLSHKDRESPHWG
jgi:hypothetical protein